MYTLTQVYRIRHVQPYTGAEALCQQDFCDEDAITFLTRNGFLDVARIFMSFEISRKLTTLFNSIKWYVEIDCCNYTQGNFTAIRQALKETDWSNILPYRVILMSNG